MPERATAILLRFARLASETGGERELLPLLAKSVSELAGASGAVVLRVGDEDVLSVAATEGLDDGLRDFRADADELGAPLADAVLAAIPGRFAAARTLPLVSGGGLFGAVVLLYADAAVAAATVGRLEFASGLADLAATTLLKTSQLEQLRRSHAELRASQQVLVRTERLRALGQMSAGITHDLRNLMNPLSLHVQVAQRALATGDNATVSLSLDELRGAIRRGVEVIDRLRSFSRESSAEETPIADLNRLAHDAGQLARPRAASRGHRISAIVEEFGTPPPIRVHAGEVVSAILNLIVNAVDAMGHEGGTVTLRTGEDRGGAWVEVADTGPGMPPEVARRVFEPFFTTKGEGGTGLGLAMVQACADAHHGSVTLDSVEGRGTTFRVWFPGAR